MKTNKIVGQALRLPGEMRRKHKQRWAGGAPALQLIVALGALAFAAPLARGEDRADVNSSITI
jgi:hypothetical protein